MTLLMLRCRYAPAALVAATFLIGTTVSAQLVVDVDHNATTGFYANWGAGNADADNPASSSYNSYRKGGITEPTPGLPTASDNGDGETATWTNLTHGGDYPCCGNPGMFFGESPSTSSYSDAVLFFGNNIEAGNGNDNDTNGHRQFDFRFGFTESVEDWLDGKAPDSGAMDLWTGDHGSDTIYLQGKLNSSDTDSPHDREGGNFQNATNKFVHINQTLMAQAGSDDDISINGNGQNDERSRDRWFKNLNDETGISVSALTVVDSSQPELDLEITGTGLAVSALDTGVAYEDNVSIEWWMELNDPGNADPALARQVKFNIEIGNLTYSQVFDPGGDDLGTTDDDVVPNPNGSPGVAFDDGYFDWQNATPIFFLGPNGSAGNVDLNNALTMGFTLPGDYNSDGKVDAADYTVWRDGDSPDDSQDGYDEWAANFGADNTASSSAGAAAPEPTSLLLVLGSLAIGALRRR